MRTRPAILAAVYLLSACAVRRLWDDQARAELRRRAQQDQALRDTVFRFFRNGGSGPDSTLVRRLQRQDSVNGAWLKAMLRERPWPGIAEVGRAEAQAAFLLVQHTRNDTAFQAAALQLVQAAFRRHDVDGQDLALLTDELLRDAGRPQRYSSKAQIESGHLVLEPLEDSAHVDQRRAALGLMPLHAYLQFLDSLYGLGPRPRVAPH